VENLSYAGDAQFTDDAALDLDAFQLEDYWLEVCAPARVQ